VGTGGWSGCFGENIVVLLLTRFQPQIFPVYILVIVLTKLLHIDLKIMQQSILIK